MIVVARVGRLHRLAKITAKAGGWRPHPLEHPSGGWGLQARQPRPGNPGWQAWGPRRILHICRFTCGRKS